MPRFSFLAIILLTTVACSKKIQPDRSQFRRDGEAAPTVDLKAYKSVQTRKGQDPQTAVALSITGGGHRAANFGVGVMLGLEQLKLSSGRNALEEIDYLSTVSGGGFAGGAYIRAKYEHQYYQRQEPFLFRKYVEESIADALTADFAWPIFINSLNPLLLFTPIDDGDVLEKKIDDFVLGYKARNIEKKGAESIQLGDMFRPFGSDKPVTLPYHITNSSTVTTLSIFPFTPDILDTYKINGYSHRKKRNYFDENWDAYQVPLSVGIKASGSFPVLISNSTLRSAFSLERPFLHLMDGAMTDNFGFYTAANLLQQEKAARRVLLLVDAEAGVNLYTFRKNEGSVKSWNVAGSLPASGLSARRSVLLREIEVLEREVDIQTVILGFNTLIEGNDAPYPKVIKPKEAFPYLINKMNNEQESLEESERQMLYEILSNIGTKYTMKDHEQELLFLAGQLIVKLREPAIRAALERN